MTVKCWRQKLFCFLSSLSTSAELGGSCLSSCGRVGLHRNTINERIMGCGAKSLEKWLCALGVLQMKMAESSVREALRNTMQFLSVLACCDPHTAGWGLESLWIQQRLWRSLQVHRLGCVCCSLQHLSACQVPRCQCIPQLCLPTVEEAVNPGSAASQLAEITCRNQAQQVRRAHSAGSWNLR